MTLPDARHGSPSLEDHAPEILGETARDNGRCVPVAGGKRAVVMWASTSDLADPRWRLSTSTAPASRVALVSTRSSSSRFRPRRVTQTERALDEVPYSPTSGGPRRRRRHRCSGMPSTGTRKFRHQGGGERVAHAFEVNDVVVVLVGDEDVRDPQVFRGVLSLAAARSARLGRRESLVRSDSSRYALAQRSSVEHSKDHARRRLWGVSSMAVSPPAGVGAPGTTLPARASETARRSGRFRTWWSSRPRCRRTRTGSGRQSAPTGLAEIRAW